MSTTRISVDSNLHQATGAKADSIHPVISSDGRYVGYMSYADNLVTGDTNGTWDVFLYDTISKKTTRVSVDSNLHQATWGSFSPTINSDGPYVA